MKHKWVLALLMIISALMLTLWHLNRVTDDKSVISLACLDPLSDCGNAQTQIRFSQIPSPMREFQVQITDQDAQSITLSFAMQDMPMGLNRYRMTNSGNHWLAKVILPVCVQGRSDWRMLIERQVDHTVTHAQIKFKAQGRTQ